jgi:hypothetical protein
MVPGPSIPRGFHRPGDGFVTDDKAKLLVIQSIHKFMI